MTCPPSWAITKLGDICEVVSGSTPSTAVPEYWGGEIAWITPDDLSRHAGKLIARGARNITQAGYDSCSTRIVPQGTVLFTSRAPIGYVAIAAQSVCTNQGFKSFIPSGAVTSDYLYWFLRYATPAIRELGSGTTFQELSKARAKEIQVPVAPSAEQRRIVAAIEEHFSRLDAAEVLLESAHRRLRVLRRLLFRTAFAGVDARVALAEVAEIVSGQTPKGMNPLPDGPVPFFKVGDMNAASGYEMAGARAYVDDALIAQYKLKVRPAGTVIFPKRGGAIATNKKRILLRPAAFDLNTMGLVPADELLPKYLLYWLETLDLSSLADGSNVPQINVPDVAPLRIPLPPLDEQRRIVAEVEQQLSVVDAMAAEIDRALKRSAALRRSILERAFSGKLVPQDPSDEPASALLERIAAERGVVAVPSRRHRKSH